MPSASLKGFLLMYQARFLLAQLHMDSLRDKTSVKLIRKALETLPTGSKALDVAYNGAMQRISDQLEGFRIHALRLLGWLTYSKRLMTIKELQYALAIEPETTDFDEDNIVDIDEVVGFCAGLVIVDDETGNIQLVHYTTQEYFRRNGDLLLASAKEEIAINCLTYLSYDQFGDGWISDIGYGKGEDERVQEYPFLAYAARHWADHVKLCDQQNVEELMVSFTKDDRKISSASQVVFAQDRELLYWRDIERIIVQNPLTVMHILAYLGCQELVSKLLAYGLDADAKDFFQRTPLWWAASQGHQTVVELILSQKDVNVNSCGIFYNAVALGEPLNSIYTPLTVAVLGGHYEIAKLLIEREDVDVNLFVDNADSPLYIAVNKGFGSLVDLFLERKDIDINNRDCNGETPLRYAVRNGHEDIVKKLLKIDTIQANLKDRSGSSPLNLAIRRGQERVVKALLSHADIEVNSRDIDEKTPLTNATGNDDQAVVELLLSHPDIEVNLTDSNGNTALHLAVKGHSISIVELLISRSDTDVN